MNLFDVNRPSGKEKKTPLIIAIEKNDTKKFNRLVNHEKIDISLSDAFSRTPLMYAFLLGRVEFVQTLLQKGASIHPADITGRNLFFYYAELNKPEVLKYLISLGAHADTYSDALKKHAFSVMSESTLQVVVPLIPFNDMISIVKHHYIDNKVRRYYLNYLKQLQKWKQLKRYLLAMGERDDLREIKVELFEALPPEFIDEKIKDNILENYILQMKIPEVANLISEGVNLNQLIKKELVVGSDPYPRQLIETEIWDDLLQHLEQTANYPGIKKLLLFAVNVNDAYKYENILESTFEEYKNALRKLYAMLPKDEKDQETLQTAFTFLDNGTQKSLISAGFDWNFTDVDGQHLLHKIDDKMRSYIFKRASMDKLLLVKEMAGYWHEYLDYLSQKKDWEKITKLYGAVDNEDVKVAISKLLTEEGSLPVEMKQELTKLYRLKPYLFMDMPAGFVQLNDGELKNILKYYVKTFKNSEDFDGILNDLAKKMKTQNLKVDYSVLNCGQCNGTGRVGNFDAPLERDTYWYPCSCDGKKELEKLVATKNGKVIMNYP